MGLLENVHSPADVKSLSPEQLTKLAVLLEGTGHECPPIESAWVTQSNSARRIRARAL